MRKIITKILLLTYLFTINPYYGSLKPSAHDNDLYCINTSLDINLRFDAIIENAEDTIDIEQRLTYFNEILEDPAILLSTKNQNTLNDKITCLQEVIKERNKFMPGIKQIKKKMILKLVSKMAKLPKKISPELLAEFIQENIHKSADTITKKSIQKNDIQTAAALLKQKPEGMAVINLLKFFRESYLIYQYDDSRFIINRIRYILSKTNRKNKNSKEEWILNIKNPLESILPDYVKSAEKSVVLNIKKDELLNLFNELFVILKEQALEGNPIAINTISMLTKADIKNKYISKIIDIGVIELNTKKTDDIVIDIFRILTKYNLTKAKFKGRVPIRLSTPYLDTLEYRYYDYEYNFPFISIDSSIISWDSDCRPRIEYNNKIMLDKTNTKKLIILRELLSREKFEEIIVDIAISGLNAEFNKTLKNIKILQLLANETELLFTIEPSIKKIKEKFNGKLLIVDSLPDSLYINFLESINTLSAPKKTGTNTVLTYIETLTESNLEKGEMTPIKLYYIIHKFMYIHENYQNNEIYQNIDKIFDVNLRDESTRKKEKQEEIKRINEEKENNINEIMKKDSKEMTIWALLTHDKIKKHEFIVLDIAKWLIEENKSNPEELLRKLKDKISDSLLTEIHIMIIKNMAKQENAMDKLKKEMEKIIKIIASDINIHKEALGTPEIQKQNWKLIRVLLDLDKSFKLITDLDEGLSLLINRSELREIRYKYIRMDIDMADIIKNIHITDLPWPVDLILNGSLDRIEYLLKKKFLDINYHKYSQVYHRSHTFLSAAAMLGQIEIVKTLVNKWGADTEINIGYNPEKHYDSSMPMPFNEKAIDIAAEYGNLEIVEFLREKGSFLTPENERKIDRKYPNLIKLFFTAFILDPLLESQKGEELNNSKFRWKNMLKTVKINPDLYRKNLEELENLINEKVERNKEKGIPLRTKDIVDAYEKNIKELFLNTYEDIPVAEQIIVDKKDYIIKKICYSRGAIITEKWSKDNQLIEKRCIKPPVDFFARFTLSAKEIILLKSKQGTKEMLKPITNIIKSHIQESWKIIEKFKYWENKEEAIAEMFDLTDDPLVKAV